MQTKQHTYPSCPFKPEELLGRDPITLNSENTFRTITGHTVLITGAAGTIGRELALQICACRPAKVILLDQSETALHDLDLFLRQKFPQTDLHCCMGNITDALRMSELFSSMRIQIVFHAAAYKHVPFMELHPYEAIKTNILGTEIIADLAVSYRVEKFVYISTDKAIRPASVMGATKRFAEIYLQYLSSEYPDPTRFVITRFGNVLGSNGSFLIRFARQIQEGGPVTVTHPEAERYMMTATEACQLVLEAAASSKGGEIFSFDMGQPVRIVDIARRLILLSGLKPDTEVEIQFTGLRQGEKLTEEPAIDPAASKEQSGKLKSIPFAPRTGGCLLQRMSELQKALDSGQPERMVAVLKAAIPEYISANSPFTKLDKAPSEQTT
ncbi:polysaccharide biosynthesis protein [Dyadobacter sp. CY261]|uniref:polysaccharide biosynthesis protein n=1 Tax=Dyadobacter sp. CY261 TaxID=2907203 RepID=UPI001F3B17C6|nr:polysaccharide biosynthesis protein [Dyadobacter sp. CY261]MCF0072604.1 polysaccharide biosynthesis protein [Dyadobacter sp. CY261]